MATWKHRTRKSWDLVKVVEYFTLNSDEDEKREEMVSPRAIVRMGPSGFDAKLTRDHFIKKAKKYPVTSRDKPLLLNGKKYYEKCHPEHDLLMFISLFNKYGNNIQKALRESNTVGSSIIMRKCALYGIQTVSPTGRGLRHDQLSLSRIALAFPIHTAMMILMQKVSGILIFSTFFEQELPLVMQHTIFPGLIPAKQLTNDLRQIAVVLNIEKSVILSRCKLPLQYLIASMTFGELIELSAKYVDAAINNSIDDEKKLAVLKKAGIIDVNDDGEFKLSATTVALVNKLEGIKTLYSLKYSDAVCKMKINNNEESDSDWLLEASVFF